ncbi:MAG: TIGR03936 family radical SAM-associated protein [Lawsonibacter sp.]
MADRLLFSKTGRAKYISHLDLMRTFQRAFARAHIQIKHTEGFHPHPFVSIALPLSVGYSSQCEILEFGLVGGVTAEELPDRLTAAMPEGIRIHQCYPAERKLKELACLNYIMNFEYPEGRPQETEPAMRELLSRDSLVVQKKSNKSKKGFTEVDLIALIRSWNLECQSDTMTLDAVVSAQNPGLNPELIRAAFCSAYPELAPDFVTFHRREVLDGEGKPFR